MFSVKVKSTAAEASGTFVLSVYEAECGRSFEEITLPFLTVGFVSIGIVS